MTLSSAALLLFLVLDPFGNLPFFLTVLARVDPARRRRVVVRELLLALVALVAFLFLGPFLLQALRVSEPALTVAGGIILFLIALRMIFPGRRGPFDDELEGEPFLVPLAIPYVAGPSALASVLLIMNRDPERWREWLGALLAAWAATAVILVLGTGLSRHLGRRGLIAMERLMGMVLTTLAVQMLLDGLDQYLSR